MPVSIWTGVNMSPPPGPPKPETFEKPREMPSLDKLTL